MERGRRGCNPIDAVFWNLLVVIVLGQFATFGLGKERWRVHYGLFFFFGLSYQSIVTLLPA